ncbi:MAG: hypothetical protein HFF36_06785 [Coprobacillus sp.]|nr:hypothetical protein [Coprobacillus sp.]
MRTTKMIKNFITDFFPQIIIMIIALFKSKIMLQYLGQETLGLYQLFAQVITYLALAEGGLASAAVYRLYKPIADKDNQKIAEIANATRNVFMIVSGIILVLGIGISFVVPFLIENNTFSYGYIISNFILYVISEVVVYLTIYRRALFEANQEKYKINIIYQTSLILHSLLEIAILMLGGNLTSLFIMFICLNTVTSMIILLYGKKTYSYLPKTKKADYSLVKDVKNLFIHKISALISNNVDVIIISKVLGLVNVVIYTTYNYIINSLKLVVDKLYGAALGGIGNVLATDKDTGKKLFFEYNSLVFFFALVLGIPLLYAIDYFIDIWYSNEIYTSMLLSILFVVNLVYYIIRTPLISFTTAAGLFKETNKCAILEVIINLSLSLILVNIIGIPGVLIGTIVSLVISEYMIKPIIIYKKVFGEGVKEYYLRNLKFVLYLIIGFVLIYVLKLHYRPINIIQWFFSSVIIGVVNLGLVTGYFILVKELLFKDRVMNLIHLRKKEG